MEKLPVLYKRAKTGAIVFWEVEVRSSDLLEGAQIKKTTGQLGTLKPTEHIDSIHQGKNIGKANETTPLQQAESQAKSDWTRKHDEGYKSLEDLGITYAGKSSDKVDPRDVYNCPGGCFYLKDCIELMLPKFNTDAAGNVKPMLAKTVDWNKVTYPCYIQPKLDGVRCLMIGMKDVESENGNPSVTFLSRSGKEYTTLGHIAADVGAYIYSWLPENFILDGEIYSDELSFQDIVAAVKKQRPDSLKLHFRAYDVVSDEPQHSRIITVEHLVKAIGSPLVTMVEYYCVDNQAHIKMMHDDWVTKGYEGAMIRLLDGHYGQGQRSSHLLKVKEFDEAEFIFQCFEVGKREEDLIAVCVTPDNKEFRAKMQGNKLSKAALQTECGELQGSKLTVKHFGWTDDGLPRFPVGKAFRDY